jgi:septum formation protein
VSNASRQLILASRSPRRRELLQQIGITAQIIDADIDERHHAGETAVVYAQRVARDKATAGLSIWHAAHPDSVAPLVLAADTIVVLDDETGEILLGKPQDRADAMAMLARLSAKTHRVVSAVCITDGQRYEQALSQTAVSFRPISEAEIAAYWATGEPADKAGSYGIQGMAAIFIARIDGSYSGVMGLPLCETAALLQRFGIDLLP